MAVGSSGSNFICYILQRYKPASANNAEVLTYAGNLANLDGVAQDHGERYEFFKADIANTEQNGCSYGRAFVLCGD